MACTVPCMKICKITWCILNLNSKVLKLLKLNFCLFHWGVHLVNRGLLLLIEGMAEATVSLRKPIYAYIENR